VGARGRPRSVVALGIYREIANTLADLIQAALDPRLR
jgi:ABC-type dipeptide/oligopeptide/nickel transport system permease component